MPDNKTDLFGKKIFFLNPAYSVKKDVISKLQKEEYEIYIIENYRDAKNLLRKQRDSILLINIDAQLSVGAWFNFIRSFEKDEALSTIYIAVISERVKASDADLFRRVARIPGGVIDFDRGVEGITKDIIKILEETDAKGRRQYVRANLTYDKEASLFWNHGSKMHQLKLLDISSVGMAVKVPQVLAQQIIAKNFLLSDVTMRLGTKQLVVECVIFAVKQAGADTIWILLLLPQTSSVVKNEIRNYVLLTNQKEIFTSINNDHQDDVDYNQLNYYNLATKYKGVGGAATIAAGNGQ